VLHRDIENHGKIVGSVVKLCKRPDASCNTVNVRRIANGLERRWHLLFLRSLEWQCYLESLSKKENCRVGSRGGVSLVGSSRRQNGTIPSPFRNRSIDLQLSHLLRDDSKSPTSNTLYWSFTRSMTPSSYCLAMCYLFSLVAPIKVAHHSICDRVSIFFN
jgi:hypothetical protein